MAGSEGDAPRFDQLGDRHKLKLDKHDSKQQPAASVHRAADIYTRVTVEAETLSQTTSEINENAQSPRNITTGTDTTKPPPTQSVHAGTSGIPYASQSLLEVRANEQADPEVNDADDVTLATTVGKFCFGASDHRAYYNSDESFYCLRNYDDDDDDDYDGATLVNVSSSEDEGDYHLDLEEGNEAATDACGGLLQTDCGESGNDDADAGTLFPWIEAGVVDLETASNWDFGVLTKLCQPPAAREIIERTLSFVRRLSRVQVLRVLMQEHLKVRDDQIDAIFHNLDQVLKLHCAILSGFKDELLKRPVAPRVGQVLRRHASYYKLHEQLACHNASCRQEIEKLTRTNSAFRAAHDKFKAAGDRMVLGDLLFEPYKYVIDCKCQLSRYMKETRDKQDRQDAEVAFSIVESILRAIDQQSMAYYETNLRMMEIRPLFKKKKIEIMKAHRTLQLEGKLCLVSPQDGLQYACEVFLFSDILVLCTPCLADYWASSIHIIGMHNTVVLCEEPDIIVVYSPDKVVELQISGANRKKWLKALTDVAHPPPDFEIKSDFGIKVVAVDVPLGSRAPRYNPAHTVKACSMCRKLFVRRSRNACHCNACGQVVCVTCCRQKVLLRYRAEAERRVCDRCWRRLQVHSIN